MVVSVAEKCRVSFGETRHLRDSMSRSLEIDVTRSADIHDMKGALGMVRMARAVALGVFKRDFPDLYTPSARAFEQPLGSIPHEMRTKEFLTEWDNALGKSPLECLAEGRVDAVRDVLAARVSDD